MLVGHKGGNRVTLVGNSTRIPSMLQPSVETPLPHACPGRMVHGDVEQAGFCRRERAGTAQGTAPHPAPRVEKLLMSRIVRSRAPGAFWRAALVAMMVLLPELLLGRGPGGAPQILATLALLAALFTLVEYAACAPSVIEFRDARPYNRLRVCGLLAAILVACAMLRPDWSDTAWAQPFRWLGEEWAELLALPWSPVHLLLDTLPQGADPDLARAVFAAAAAAYGLSLLIVLLFALVVRFRGWPLRSAFNIWVNLPQFDPTAGDVVERLQQNALVNVALGFMLPLIAPMVANLLSAPFDGGMLRDPAMLVWVVIAWAFVPASLAMRGLALHRLSVLIAAHRERLQRREALAQA